MRVIPDAIPRFEALASAASVERDRAAEKRNRSGDWADRLGKIIHARRRHRQDECRRRRIHILTIEDPIEFLHRHKKATIHQRELHSDTPTFALALRGALRQAPKVILVGEMRDRETIEIALEAAETGHLVMSTLHTIDASKTSRANRRRVSLGGSASDTQSFFEGFSLHRVSTASCREKTAKDESR